MKARWGICEHETTIAPDWKFPRGAIPKTSLEAWGLKEGDSLELTSTSIRARRRAGFTQQELDELNRSLSLAVVDRFSPAQIRAQILANLHRWKARGSWVSAYSEWQQIAEEGDDGALYAAMLGRDENAIRLRHSMPFVGLLSHAEVRALHE